MSDLSTLFGALGAAIIFVFLFAIAAYVVICLAFAKVLKIYGYDNTWMAWLPYFQQYALADAVSEKKETMKLFSFDVPSIVFKIYWIIPLLISWFLPDFSILGTIVTIIGLGTVCGHAYARIEGKSYDETKVLGLLSGFVSVIAVIKFLSYDKNLRLSTQSNYTEPNVPTYGAPKN